MKTLLTILSAAGLAFGTITAFSQAPAAPVPAAPAAPPAAAPSMADTLKMLQSIRDQNAKLIEQQTATLKLLEEMEKTSQQLKFFGKRS
jgi:hypothetical protein